MKKVYFLIVGLTIVFFAHGQTIKIQGGVSISKLEYTMTWDNDLLFEQKLIGYSFFAGVDYFDKRYFNLSSNIGLVRKGGKTEMQFADQNDNLEGSMLVKPALDYLSINTTIDFKYPIKKFITPFISFGPRLDYIYKVYHLDSRGMKRFAPGLIMGGGLKYEISNLQLGLRADYYLDFSKIAGWTKERIRSGVVPVNTYTVNLSVGYRIR